VVRTGGAGLTAGTNITSSPTTAATTAVNQNTGGGGAHNNLQPYVTVAMWLRTA
jgi:microcystin-dependent protein